MKEELKLKPCPFCGGEAHLQNWSDGAYVWCECGVKTETYLHSGTEKAIEAWNRRAEPERKKGMWEVQPSTGDDRPFIWWKCSVCGHVIFSETERDRKEFHAYCGRCGADME